MIFNYVTEPIVVTERNIDKYNLSAVIQGPFIRPAKVFERMISIYCCPEWGCYPWGYERPIKRKTVLVKYSQTLEFFPGDFKFPVNGVRWHQPLNVGDDLNAAIPFIQRIEIPIPKIAC